MKILMMLFLMITLVLGYLGVAWMSVSATQVEVGASDLQEVKYFNPWEVNMTVNKNIYILCRILTIFFMMETSTSTSQLINSKMFLMTLSMYSMIKLT